MLSSGPQLQTLATYGEVFDRGREGLATQSGRNYFSGRVGVKSYKNHVGGPGEGLGALPDCCSSCPPDFPAVWGLVRR